MLMVSMSLAASTLPSTCTTSGSSNPRTTCGDRIRLADVREELVAEPLADGCALDDARDVDERNGRGDDSLASGTGRRAPAAADPGRFTMPTFGSIVANG